MKMKSKYWPFTRYKWSRSYGRSEALSYDLYHESIQMQNLDWEDAYPCCRDDIKFLNKYGRRFEDRYEPAGIFRFLALALATSLLVALIAFMCWKQEITFLRVLIILGVSVVLIALEFLLRVLYYRGIEYDLIHADNRVSSLESVWPEIVDIVNYNIATGSTNLPFEPEKAFESEKFRIVKANLAANDDVEDSSIAVLFGNDETNSGDVEKAATLDEVFASLVAENTAKSVTVTDDVTNTDVADNATELDAAMNAAVPDADENVVKPNLADDTTESDAILELISKIDALNKCLQIGL